MKIYYLGTPPADFSQDAWPAPPEPLYDQPMYEVDALFVFTGSPVEAESRYTYQLVERMGRPIVRVGAVSYPIDRRQMPGNSLLVARYTSGDCARYLSWIRDRPRTNYVPVHHQLLEEVERCVHAGAEVDFTLRRADGLPMKSYIAASHVKRIHGEHYVQLSDGCWFRMDRVLAVNGKTFSVES